MNYKSLQRRQTNKTATVFFLPLKASPACNLGILQQPAPFPGLLYQHRYMCLGLCQCSDLLDSLPALAFWGLEVARRSGYLLLIFCAEQLCGEACLKLTSGGLAGSKSLGHWWWNQVCAGVMSCSVPETGKQQQEEKEADVCQELPCRLFCPRDTVGW